MTSGLVSDAGFEEAYTGCSVLDSNYGISNRLETLSVCLIVSFSTEGIKVGFDSGTITGRTLADSCLTTSDDVSCF